MRVGQLLHELVMDVHRPVGLHPELASALTLVDGVWALRGFKCSYPTERPGIFAGLTGNEFARDSKALCAAHCSGPVPRLGCICGFHAYAATRFVGAPDPWKGVTLEVGLTGRVLVYAAPGGESPDVLVAERQVVLAVNGRSFHEAMSTWAPMERDGNAEALASRFST
jgi:hypothetical protein